MGHYGDVRSVANGGRATRTDGRRVLWSLIALIVLLALASALAFVPYTASGSRNRSSAVSAVFGSCRGDSPRAWSDGALDNLGPDAVEAFAESDAARRVCTRSARVRLAVAGVIGIVGAALFLWSAFAAWRTTGRRIRGELAAQGP